MKSGRPTTRLRSHSRLVPLVLFVDLAFAARCNRQVDPAPPSRRQFAAASAVRSRTVTRTRRPGCRQSLSEALDVPDLHYVANSNRPLAATSISFSSTPYDTSKSPTEFARSNARSELPPAAPLQVATT